jgi:hypothetical protein
MSGARSRARRQGLARRPLGTMRRAPIAAVAALLVLPVPGNAFASSEQAEAPEASEVVLVAGGFTVHPRGRPVDSTVLVFGCHATAVGATAVSITSCTYKGAQAPALSLPGPVAATASTAVDFEDEPGAVCWEAHAVTMTGGERLHTAGCSQGPAGITVVTG